MAGAAKQSGEALRRLHADVLGFCRDVTDEEWIAPSKAETWRIHDCVAHMGGTSKSLFTPTSLRIMFGKDIERTNDVLVDSRRTWNRSRVVAEYDTWGKRVAGMVGGLGRTPVAGLRVPLAELGRFPLGTIMGPALVFDQHTHLHHDMAPALDREAPATDELRMGLVLSWMFDVLGNQLASSRPTWLDRPLAITLEGPGGGTWRIEPGPTVVPGDDQGAAARLRGRSVDFPAWGTGRTPAAHFDVDVHGDEELGRSFLASLNIV